MKMSQNPANKAGFLMFPEEIKNASKFMRGSSHPEQQKHA
jgi:hypothetical protein